MGQLLGDTRDEVVLEPEVGDVILIMLVEQVDELASDVIELALLGVGLLALVRLGDSLGLGAHAILAGEAAVGVAAEVAIVGDRLLIEARVIGVGGLHLDDGFFVLDLVFVLGLGFLGSCMSSVGPRWGGLRCNWLLFAAFLDPLPNHFVQMIDSGVSS